MFTLVKNIIGAFKIRPIKRLRKLIVISINGYFFFIKNKKK